MAETYTIADIAYERGYEDAVRDIKEREIRRKRLKTLCQNRRRRRIIALIKQKTIGVQALALSIIAPILLDGDITASILMAPVGLVLIFSKEIY